MSNDKTQKEEVFIGARVLGEDGVKLVLPTYEVLKSQISQMKSAANNTGNGNNDFSKAMKYNREHNNTIAIFGSRGTGKTSALYTLMNDLEKENTENFRKNIVLPIIEPDNFGDNTKIMGSIIGLIKNEVDILLNEIKGDSKKPEPYFKNCIYIENNSLKQKMDELLEYHMYSDTEYRNIITHNYKDTATHIKKSSHLLIPDINLKQKFWDVIDEIVKHKLENKQQSTIFIFIDDIDLKTTKCKELIEAIMQFSSHPNVITILSGDYKILEEGLMLSLIGDENLREKGLDTDFILKGTAYNDNEENTDEITIKDRKLKLAENYLKKIIPPSRRHYVVNWNIDNIPEFSFGETKLKDILYKFYNNKDNIFGFKANDENICSTKYPYIIFDTTPRGLINVYYSFSRVINNNKKNFFDIKLLIDTIINSSPELLKNKEEFYDVINWGSDFESTKIDYKKLYKDDEDNHRPKYKFICLVIVDLLISCSELIDYDKKEYEIAKKNVVSESYYSYLSLIKTTDDNENKYIQSENNPYSRNLYKEIIAFVKLLDFKESIFLLELLCDFRNKDTFYYENYWDDTIRNSEKDKWAFKCIFKFLEKNNFLKEKLIEINNYSRNMGIDGNEISIFINFLENMAKLKNNVIYSIENIYDSVKNIYDSQDIKYAVDSCKIYNQINIPRIQTRIQTRIHPIISNRKKNFWEYSHETLEAFINREITITALNNFFQKIDEIEINNKKNDRSVKKVNELKEVNRKLYEEGLTSKQINLVRNIMNDILGDFFKDISKLKKYKYDSQKYIDNLINNEFEELEDLEYEEIISEIVNNTVFCLDENILEFDKDIIDSGIEAFLSVTCGQSSKFSYVQNYILEFLNKDITSKDFIKIYKDIKDLSENNRIWYGKYESIEFLDKLKKAINIDVKNINFNLELIKEIIKFEKNFNNINDKNNDLEFRKIQEIMRNELKNAFEDSRELMKNEYESIGISFNEEMFK